MILPGLLAGMGLAAGCLALARGIAPSPPPLSKALARLAVSSAGEATAPAVSGRVGAVAVAALRASGADGPGLRRDLRVLGRAVEQHAVTKLVAAWSSGLLAVVTGAVLVAGGVGVPWALVSAGAVSAAALGFVVPELTVRGEAERRRRELADALSSYLELVVVLLAGGGGTETALHDATRAGDGPLFVELRGALERSRLAGQTPWAALDRLGADLGVVELQELAASMTLAGEHGARVRASLAAKAESMREHRLARIHAEAEEATEKMSVPTVLMLFGFIAFVLYPAMQFVLTGL